MLIIIESDKKVILLKAPVLLYKGRAAAETLWSEEGSSQPTGTHCQGAAKAGRSLGASSRGSAGPGWAGLWAAGECHCCNITGGNGVLGPWAGLGETLRDSQPYQCNQASPDMHGLSSESW